MLPDRHQSDDMPNQRPIARISMPFPGLIWDFNPFRLRCANDINTLAGSESTHNVYYVNSNPETTETPGDINSLGCSCRVRQPQRIALDYYGPTICDDNKWPFMHCTPLPHCDKTTTGLKRGVSDAIKCVFSEHDQ